MKNTILLTLFFLSFNSFSTTHIVTSKNTTGVGTISDKTTLAAHGDTITFNILIDTINDPLAWGINSVIIDKNITFIGNPTVIRNPMSALIFDIKDAKVNFEKITFIGVPEWGPQTSITSTGNIHFENCTFTNASLKSSDSLTMNNCNFKIDKGLNTSAYVVYSSGNFTSISNTQFISTNKYVAGISLNSANYLVENCYFEGLLSNTAFGGAIFSSTSTEGKIHNCTFNNNHNTNKGGAVGVLSGNVEISNCTFYKNHSWSHGGAIINKGDLTIKHCTFGYNTADTYGAGIHNGGSLIISNSIFANNSAVEKGDDIFNMIVNGSSNYDSFESEHTIYSDTSNCFFNFKHNSFPTIIIDPTLILNDGLDELSSKGVLMFNQNDSPINAGVAITGLEKDQKNIMRDNSPDLGSWEYSIITNITTSPSISGFEVYPNPTTQILYFSNTTDQIKLYSHIGQLILEKKIQSKSIDLSHLPSDIYILEVWINGERSSKLIQVSH